MLRIIQMLTYKLVNVSFDVLNLSLGSYIVMGDMFIWWYLQNFMMDFNFQNYPSRLSLIKVVEFQVLRFLGIQYTQTKARRICLLPYQRQFQNVSYYKIAFW